MAPRWSIAVSTAEAQWIDDLAAGGRLSRQSIQICRTVSRAALNEAVDEGLIPRSPAARVGLPRAVAKPTVEKETVAWTSDEVDRFLEATGDHRWAIAFRLCVLYGLRRSEVLTLRWDDLDTDAQALRIDESLVSANEGGGRSSAVKARQQYESAIPHIENVLGAIQLSMLHRDDGLGGGE